MHVDTVSPSQPSFSENRFIALLVNHYREIVEKAFKDMEYVTSNEYTEEFTGKFPTHLAQGIWTPDDYWRASQKWGLKPTQTMLKKNRKGYLPVSTFSRCSRDFTFRVNEGILPSDAISMIGKKPSLLDSGSIYMLAFHRALIDFLGADKFNRIFSEHSFIFSNLPNIRLTWSLFKHQTIKSSEEIQVGDRCCFKNTLAFSVKHGISEEYFVVFSDKKSKRFLGMGLPSEGSTKEKVERMMHKAYNTPHLLEEKNSLSSHTLSFEEFMASTENPPFPKEGKLYLEIIIRPDIEKIQKLADASLKDVMEVFNGRGQETLEKKRKV